MSSCFSPAKTASTVNFKAAEAAEFADVGLLSSLNYASVLCHTIKTSTHKLFIIKLPFSYRGQAQQRPGQIPVVSRGEDQARGGAAILGGEGDSDVLTGVIWTDKDLESLVIMFKRSEYRDHGT